MKTSHLLTALLVILLGCSTSGGSRENKNVQESDKDTSESKDTHNTENITDTRSKKDEPDVNEPVDIVAEETSRTQDTGRTTTEDIADDTAALDVAPPSKEEHCKVLGLPEVELISKGTFGSYRGDLAKPFKFYAIEGDPWSLSEHWTGCDVYVFITNAASKSQLNPAAIWDTDLDQLLLKSPKNVHYFFVATRNKAKVMTELESIQGRIEETLSNLPADQAAFWQPRLHVAGGHPANFPKGLLKTMFASIGTQRGFAVDRSQQIRLMGNLADVTRFKEDLEAQDMWPWESNLAYISHEVRRFNFMAVRDAKLAAEKDVTIVSPWSGEVLKYVVETETEFPDEATMAGFDSLDIDLTMDCPSPEKAEFGNCGAWDYLVHLYMQDTSDQAEWIEVARFISTYHREGRYIVNADHMLPYLKSGGKRKLKYSISPQWNQQAYLTQMDFRFSNKAVGTTPQTSHFLWSGQGFNSGYNAKFEAKEVAIPTDAKKVEIRAIITGHGMETNNCAEFCNHGHFFTINGKTFEKSHPIVGNSEGCIDQIENGMTPNQGGTWWFGRGGWCPGQQVEPWIQDITAHVKPGETAKLSYMAKYNGGAIPDKSGNIVMSSFLVIHK